MAMLDVVDKLNSDISNANTTDPEIIKRKIDVYGCYTRMAYEMYETTEKAADNYSDKIGEKIDVYSYLDTNPNVLSTDQYLTDSKAKAFAEGESDEKNILKNFRSYGKDMLDIDSRYAKESRDKPENESEAHTVFNGNLYNKYTNMIANEHRYKDFPNLCASEKAEGRTAKIAAISVFESYLDSNNSIEFLNIVTGLNTGLEKLRQARDARLAGVEYDEDKHIYSFNSHKDFAYVDHPEPQLGLERAYHVGGIKLDNEEKLMDRKEHYDHIIAEKELEDKFDARNIGKLLNSKIVLKYLMFNPEEYMALAEKAKDTNKEVNIPDRLSDDRAAPVLSAQDGSEIDVGSVPRGRAEKENALLEKIDEICSGAQLAFEAMSNIIGCEKVKSVFEWLMPFIGLISPGKEKVDFVMDKPIERNDEIGDKDEQVHERNNKGLNDFDIIFSFLSTVLDVIPLICGEKSAIGSAAEKISPYVGLVSDLVSLIGSISDIFFADSAIDKIKEGMARVEGSYGDNADRTATGKETQDLRILNAASTAQRKKRSEAILDTATSGIDIVGDVLSIAGVTDAAGLIVKGIGFAVSLIGKWAISKYFRADLKNGTWMNVLGMDKDSYNGLMKKMGGKSNIRFRNVIRRKTGLATREDYARALLTTDAVDLYAASKAVWVNNKINAANRNRAENRNVDNVMGSIGFSDPQKYDKIKLADICAKMSIDKNWRKTLADSIGKTEIWAEKDEA